MTGVLGWVLALAGAALLVIAFRRSPRTDATPSGPHRGCLLAGLAGLTLGLFLAVSADPAFARARPVDLSRPDDWVINPATGPDGPIRWEGGALNATLEVGSHHYALFPVDWRADAFDAAWDITFLQLDRAGDPITLTEGGRARTHRRTRQDFASVAVGMMDQSAANIDDRDHVAGSALEATFSDDIRLRASDANFILRTASHDEPGTLRLAPNFKKGAPVHIDLNRKYHCELSYRRADRTAVLTVRDGEREVVSRRLEDVKDFTSSAAWFGVSVRGYNRFDKKLDPKKADTGYTRPKAVVRVENLSYRQP